MGDSSGLILVAVIAAIVFGLGFYAGDIAASHRLCGEICTALGRSEHRVHGGSCYCVEANGAQTPLPAKLPVASTNTPKEEE
jgi:hypothetical protein